MDEIPLDFETLPAAEMGRRAEEFRASMARRRSVRAFSDRPVPRQLIERAILTAGSAPSGANRQPWHFVPVSDPEIKRTIRDKAEQVERAERAEQTGFIPATSRGRMCTASP